ncbi:MAG: MXAN_6577-like cysteine-rich protein [Polyangiales bacterium]
MRRGAWHRRAERRGEPGAQACTTGQSCSAGACTSTCAGGTSLCSGSCVNLQDDTSNCGACGRACASTQSCTAGACTCGAGLTLCGGLCVDTSTSTANCGACGRACPSGQTCAAGACTSSCAGGATLCGGACVNTQTDGANCGACGRACPSGQTCTAGACAGCGPSVSLASQLQPIFNASCNTGCHGTVRPAGGLALSTGRSYAALVNVAASGCNVGTLRVAPGSVSSSYLMNKLTGVGMCSGNQMPANGAELPSNQLDLFRAWICNGAPNN